MPRTISAIRSERDPLVQRRHRIIEELNTLADADTLDDGQARRFDDLARAEEKLTEQISELDTELGDAIVRHASRHGGGEPGSGPDADAARDRTRRNGVTRPRGYDEAMRAISAEPFSDDDAKQLATRLVEQEPSGLAARWATVAADPDYATAFAKLVADPQRGHLEWTAEEQRAFARTTTEYRAMSIGTDSAGGFMVPFTLDPAIVLSGDGAIDPIREVARKVTTIGDQWAGVTSDGVSAEWKAEAAEAADASPTIAQPNIPVHLADIFVPFSIEAGQDATNLLGELRAIMADEKAVHEAAAWVNGTGSGQPTGFVTSLAGGSSEVSPATAETFAVEDVYGLIEKLPPRFRARARWAAELSTINDVQQFETANGAKEFPGVAQTPPMLLRRPLHEASEMDAASDIDPAVTADNHILAVGDWRHYVIVDRVGASLELVPHLVGANQRPTGQRGAFFYWRVGADVTVANAFRLLNVATTL